ncbi:hypothetical protein SISSUDRAFT_448761 [Sistotremastrum suecicum HHB10207 ss-3]|uniref:WD40 repeat-like protein n=1 Tax=Sistotremastrum suecicum HHB10207 ss-3 TaxID=1314776 RepID=A0A166FH33_9AGAM|nr:hypothetical protein SISSUDRAFT_448761 [Sistotremastrum suecicum HHB10207 ss-3]
MPPRQLPGFYWDEEKQKYFPLSSRPRILELPKPAIAIRDVNKTVNAATRLRLLTPLWHHSLTLTSSRENLELENSVASITSILSFPDTTANEQHYLLGDSNGWIHHSTAEDTIAITTAMSTITSLRKLGNGWISSSFGPGPKLLWAEACNDPFRRMISIHPPVLAVHSMDVSGSSVVLGSEKRAFYMSDLEAIISPMSLPMNSDVLSVCQDKFLTYAGARNGSVCRFDVRLPSDARQDLFGSRFNAHRSGITQVRLFDDWKLLVAASSGHIKTFDLRFSRPEDAEPVVQYPGHINTYSLNLGLALDPDFDFLAAAGQDRIVRAWSLRSGDPIFPEMQSPSDSNDPSLSIQSPCNRTFESAITSLALYPEPTTGKPVLLTGSGSQLEIFHMGQRMP